MGSRVKTPHISFTAIVGKILEWQLPTLPLQIPNVPCVFILFVHE
jgi:hypothetical protein